VNSAKACSGEIGKRTLWSTAGIEARVFIGAFASLG
jgi:hypothetical protein